MGGEAPVAMEILMVSLASHEGRGLCCANEARFRTARLSFPSARLARCNPSNRFATGGEYGIPARSGDRNAQG